MKRIFSMLMTITMLMCAVGFVPISVQAIEYTYDDLNEYEIKYNISYYKDEGSWNNKYTKIQSVDELPDPSEKYAKYDEDFFEDKFLIVLEVGTAGYSRDSFRIVSVTENESTLDIDVEYSSVNFGADLVIPWLILLEVDRTQLDKELSVRRMIDATYYTPRYYSGGVNIDYSTLEPQSKPYMVKVDSAEKLEDYTGDSKDEIVDMYNRSSKYGDYLLFVQWVEPTAGRSRGVVSVLYDRDDEESQITIKLSAFTPEEEYPTVITPYCAIIEIPSGLTDREVVLEYDDALEESSGRTDIDFEVSYYGGVSCADEGYKEIKNHETTPYAMKITSGEQLNTHWKGYSGYIKKYDDTFFADKFLYAVNWGEMNGPGHEISSLYIEDGKVNIIWSGGTSEELGPDEISSCVALVECSNVYREMEFLVKTDFELYYYDGECYDNDGYREVKDHFTAPYAVEITSAEQLAQYADTNKSVLDKYTDNFFKSKFLLAVNWKEAGTAMTHEVEIYSSSDYVGLVWSEAEPNELENAYSGNFFALIECPNKYMDGKWGISNKIDDRLYALDKIETETSYYSGSCYDSGYYDIVNDLITPYIMKITSPEELKAHFKATYEVSPPEKYNDAFFTDKFLYAITWREIQGSLPAHEISAVFYENEKVNFIWRKTEALEIGPTAPQSFFALVECPNAYRDSDYQFLAREVKAIEFSVGTVSCKAGDIIDVPLIVSNNFDIVGMSASIVFDKTILTPVSVTTAGGWRDNDKYVTTNINWWKDGANPEAPNYISISSSAKEIVSGDGEIFTLRFQVNEGVSETTTPLKASYAHFRDGDGNVVDSLLAFNGSVTIQNDDTPPKKVVTVEPPTVNLESGEVPYGSKVTISPTNGNDFEYSVNGEQFVNSRLTHNGGNAVITITEDTVLVVRSMIDVVEPDTEYVFPEATYTYTIGGCVVPAIYPYTINSLKLVSENGEEYDTPPTDKSFIVDVDITKNSERESKDYFIVAVYDTDGALISMNYIKANLPTGSDFSCGVNIPKTDKTIGSIKAFVWDALGGMTPLAEGKVMDCFVP